MPTNHPATFPTPEQLAAFSDDFNEVYNARPNAILSQPVEVCVVGKRCVYLNDYRIAGGKPYVSEGLPEFTLTATLSDIVSAFGHDKLLAAVAESKAQRDYFAAYHAWKAENTPEGAA